MMRLRTHLPSVLVFAFGILVSARSNAASLVKVTNWNAGISFPADVAMHIYVPDKVATNPPVLTLIHYCGGSAKAVFGQASTVIEAVDKAGVIVVAPDNGARCWDVQTTKGLARDGGGDSHAIAQMVRYTLATYKANADRVYSTGDSSGGMMTQLLLALYPDIFKAGASFAGIPAGCRAGNETGNGYSSACAGGTITKTAQQWGDIVRALDPGYNGHRPRVQLFHGDKDEYINFKVFGEAIKEWSNVLGLDPTAPTSTTTVTLGSHQGTRQTWKNACGFVVLDAFQSSGGDHGPSDTLFNSFVPPFLGIDTTGAVDPEIAKCGEGGATTGGASNGGGVSGFAGTRSASGTGSTAGGRNANAGASSGGQTTGGAASFGGSRASSGRTTVGGTAPSGGAAIQASGGRTASGGNNAGGGDSANAGNLASIGNSAGGSNPANSRNSASGGQLTPVGSLGTGGAIAMSIGGGAAVSAIGGNSRAAGSVVAAANNDGVSPVTDPGGCACEVLGTKHSCTGPFALSLGIMLVHLRNRRKR